MSTALDPVVVAKLRHFGRRRRALIWLRGICAGIVSFFLLMGAVAFADWSWVLSDSTRWSLSLAAYAGVVVAVWLACLRRMIHRPGMNELASRVELAEPELRERLLAAVELAADDPNLVHDSPTFRRLLQGQVAEQMTHVRIRSLLPWRLLGGWLTVATLLVGITATLLWLPNTPIRRLVTRAILPGANIDRVSRIQVTILKPTPHSLMLAEDETVAVMVEIAGGDVDDVTLETSTQQGGANRQIMRSQGKAIYVYNVQVGEESIDYRILAGDAVTKKYRIESRARPRALAFHKTFAYPAYTQLNDTKVTEKHGDLIALEGTTASLRVELDQDVSTAELRVEKRDEEGYETVPLQRQSPTEWAVEVPIDEAATYKLHLVSADTGFENIFSPKYEIRPEADLIPRVGFVDQSETTMLLPANDILPLAAMAEDDLPLVKLEQQFSVNGAQWVSLPLEAEPAKRVTTKWRWDLIPLELKQGDQVLTRLIATDRKGNIGESVPLRIVVSSLEFDPNRHRATLLKSAFYDELEEFSEEFEQQRERAGEILQRLRDTSRPEDARDLDLKALRDIATKQREEAGDLAERIEAVLQEMPAGVDSYELELVGQVIGRVRHDYGNAPTRWLREWTANSDDPKAREATLRGLEQVFVRAADDAKRLAELYRDLAAHNMLAAIAFDLDALMRQQRSAVRWSSANWERLSRQETVVLSQFRQLKNLVEAERPRLPRSTHNWLITYMDWLDTCVARLEEGMESPDKLPLLQRHAATILRELETRQRVDVTESRLPAALVSARRDFENRSGTLFVPLAELGGQANEVFARATKLRQTEDPVEQLATQRELDVKRVAAATFQASASGQLQTRRALTQARVDSDTQYAVDAGLTDRAVNRLYRSHREDPLAEPRLQEALAEIAPAYRQLEAGHAVASVRDALQNLLALERWRSQEITGRLDNPRQWDALALEMELAARKLRESGVPSEVVAKLDAIRNSPAARDAARKITTRRYQRDQMVGASYELSEMQRELTFVLSDLEPIMAEARAVISKYVPSIPEMAKQTAEAIRELEAQADALADESAGDEREDTPENTAENTVNEPPTLEELQQRQEDVNQQVDELIDALIEDANQQDILDEQQLERAKDADASMEMIRDAAQQMNQAMQEAVDATPQQQPRELSEAAEELEQTAEVLDKVADHFEKLDAGEDVADSRQSIRPESAAPQGGEPPSEQADGADQTDGEQQNAAPKSLDEKYPDAAELARMAEQNPQQLLRELEEELKRNPAMQQELSKIAENTLRQAKNTLDDAAKQDDALQRQVERADAEFQNKKKELVQDLKQVAKEAADVANSLVAQANSAANQGRVPESQKKLAKTQQDLRNAQNQANQLNENNLLSEIKQAAEEIEEAIQSSQQALTEAAEETKAAEKNEIHANDKAREAARNSLEKNRKAFNDQRLKAARDAEKRAADAERRADQAVQRAENAVRNAERQTERAKANLAKTPDNQGLKNAVDAAQRNQDRAEAAAEQQRDAQQQAKATREKAAADTKALAERKSPPLDAPNPAAQLASEHSAEAAEKVEQIAKQATDLAASIDWEQQLKPPAAALTQAKSQQEDIQQDVQQVGQDVARAARHERRLENTGPVEAIEQAAQAIESVADGEVEQSVEQLGQAQQAAAQAEDTERENAERENAEREQGGLPGGQSPAGENEGENEGERPSSPSPAAKARDAVESSENAIAQQAEQLGQILDQAQAAADAEAAAAAAAASETPMGQEPGQPGEQPGQPGEQPGQPGEQTGQPGQQPGGQASQGPPSAAEQAQAQMLAETLDELDQRQAAGGETPAGQPLSALAQATQAQRASMARSRIPYGSKTPPPNEGLESLGTPATTGDVGEGLAATVNRDDGRQWGQLRKKSAEEAAKGSRAAVAAEYRERVDAYFRVLAEKARAKK